MSYRGRDRANQLVVVEVSVDFTWHTLLSSVHEHEQRDSANERIVIVTDKLMSAVNCPIEVGIVPVSWFSERYLSIHKTHNALISYEHEQRDSANERIVIVTDKLVSAVNCPIKVVIVPFSWLL